MTSQPTEPNHIQQTLFAEDFHAPTSQSLEGAKASQRLQGLVSSSNSSQPYAWFDQNTSSWKTYQRSLITEWTLYSENFTRQGTMQNGAVSQVALLELATKEIGFGLLPTPLASDPDRKAKFKQGGTPLRAAVDQQMLPTPTVCNDSMYYDKSPNKDKRHSKGLATEIIDREMLPTPTTMDHLGQRSPEALKKQMEGARKGRTSLSNLREAVNPKTVETFNNFLPTPRAAIGMGMKLSKGMANLEHKKYLETEIAAKVHTHGEVQNTDSTQTGENMYLNPQFVEEMMGYPLNWTLNNEFKD